MSDTMNNSWGDIISLDEDLIISGGDDYIIGTNNWNGNGLVWTDPNIEVQKRLDKIEERLAILKPNPELESRWDELRNLGEKYRQLEAELTAKESVWNTLKK